ncbi:MAG TPA: tRNA pseudouridine(38-40) synthase TruA [Thiomicrospira sp.]|jgi:tRNA pseudouridine38-40 synthase|nr:tRNA pseudouridine(38-40) synthase TruA [Thiomicrospira sp.]
MKIALGIEYQGANYCGWQSQEHCISVQQHVEAALSNIANEKISVQCAGRTDSKVHAIGQVVHFETSVVRHDNAWVEGANTKLPKDIRVSWALPVPDEFNARFRAFARQYRYVIYNRSVQAAILAGRATWVRAPLNVEAMNAGAQYLVGEHDFTAFRAASCQASHAKREIQSLSVTRKGDFIFIDIKANAFLHHMVRNIAGTLLKVGKGQKEANWVESLLIGKDRSKSGMTAPAEGLYFVNAFYPEKYNIPINTLDNLLWN